MYRFRMSWMIDTHNTGYIYLYLYTTVYTYNLFANLVQKLTIEMCWIDTVFRFGSGNNGDGERARATARERDRKTWKIVVKI